jgi:hydroxymethylpyrimidine pyrophosphatase-like HAD family hydrolase
MLRIAGVGVAVANASPEAKAAADYITVHHEDHAVAAVIDELDRGHLLA